MSRISARSVVEARPQSSAILRSPPPSVFASPPSLAPGVVGTLVVYSPAHKRRDTRRPEKNTRRGTHKQKKEEKCLKRQPLTIFDEKPIFVTRTSYNFGGAPRSLRGCVVACLPNYTQCTRPRLTTVKPPLAIPLPSGEGKRKTAPL